ncbi:MAG: cold-shock protein [Sphingomonadaceae bacterium]
MKESAAAIEAMDGAGDRPAAPERLSGRVKWFDIGKGFGFVAPDDGGGDILIHYNLLARHGRKSVPEGARLVVDCVVGPRGRQASAILDLDLTTAIEAGPGGRAGPRGGRTDPLDFLEEAGDFEPVQVRWFNRTKGYGFLLRDDGVTQVFIHMETVRRGGLETLLPNQRLLARVHEGPRGALAVALRAGADR